MKVKMECHCGKIYDAKSADLKRGWGYSCSKHCAAVRRDFGRPKAKQLIEKKIKQNKPKPSSYRPNDDRVDPDAEHRRAMADCEMGWDAHKEIHP